MKQLLAVLAGLSLCVGLAQADGASWGYSGDSGPAKWGRLSPQYSLCELGRNQSPIDIRGALDASLAPLKMSDAVSGRTIVNNGHTIQVDFNAGGFLALDGDAFELKQVHFHAPSENRIAGKSYPFEAHFVHADAAGNLAVVAVMFTIGRANAGLAKLWAQMPAAVGNPALLKAVFKPAEMLPSLLDYYRFSGSLTTPPCSEGVRWVVLKTPVTASQAQIDMFEKTMRHHTNRPVQPLNARVIVQ